MYLHRGIMMIKYCRKTVLSCLIPLLVTVGVFSQCGEVHLFSTDTCLSALRSDQGSLGRCIHPIIDSKLDIFQTDSAILSEISCNCCDSGIPHPFVRAQIEATSGRGQGWSTRKFMKCFESHDLSISVSVNIVEARNLEIYHGVDLTSSLALHRLRSVRLLV